MAGCTDAPYVYELSVRGEPLARTVARYRCADPRFPCTAHRCAANARRPRPHLTRAPSSSERGTPDEPSTPQCEHRRGAPSGGRAGAARSRENRLRDHRLVRFSPRAQPALPPDGADSPTKPFSLDGADRMRNKTQGRSSERIVFRTTGLQALWGWCRGGLQRPLTRS